MSAAAVNDAALIVRELGRVAYEPTWRRMQAFTDRRGPADSDEVWLLEHPPVFTQGLAGRSEHVLAPGDIPVVAVDRGGQVTYHGPGQLVAYLLVDLRRRGLGVRRMVSVLEGAVVRVLADLGISGHLRPDAPGVYVRDAKIAQVGLRVRRGCSYHGLSFNIDMDLEPFSRINPCGHAGLEVIDLRSLGVSLPMGEARRRLLAAVEAELTGAGN
ncbi:lipoyl(octanoyl) transferase LipB [Arhodomonas sp. SL1]|uniref:lipoyl(octanoyl) transferase LipB n=1 Tax=Arhodomonas sp. SL1 TaxID=3425691 RepID=UPI003F88257F